MTKPSILDRAAWWLIVSAVVVVPLFVSLRGSEAFRTPKESLFIAIGLVLAVFVAARGAIARTPLTLLALAAVVWTAVATIFSANRAISVRTFVWVVAAAAFVVAVDVFGRKRSPLVIAVPLIPAAINAVMFLLQRFHVWNPMRFPDEVPDQFRYTALIGNPDDVGSFLVVPAMVAIALAVVDRRRRALWVPVSALIVAGLATGRLTSLIAVGGGLLAIGFLRSRRAAAIASVAVVVGGIALVIGYAPMRERWQTIVSGIRAHDYAAASSGRVTPFIAAAEMAKDHPLTGVGPGCFGFEYFPYKVAVERSHPHLRATYSTNFNYGEAHNEYLQTVAEEGLIGLAIFIAAIVILARTSRRAADDDIVRTLGLPLAVAIAILCLAHFPLHLAAPTIVLLYVATLCISRTSEEPEPLPFAPALRYAIAGVVAIVAVALIDGFAWPRFVCNERKSGLIASTHNAAEVFVDKITVATVARSNLAAIDKCVTADPTDVDFYMLAAANQNVLGRSDDALATYRSALAWDRRPEIYYEIGMLELRMNRRAEAMADLRNAAQFSTKLLEDLPAEVRKEISASIR